MANQAASWVKPWTCSEDVCCWRQLKSPMAPDQGNFMEPPEMQQWLSMRLAAW